MKYREFYIVGNTKYNDTVIKCLENKGYIYKGTISNLEQLVILDNKSSILILEAPIFITKYSNQLKKQNIETIYILDLFDIDDSIINNIREFSLLKKPLLGYIEINLVNHCNLKCKGCTHFSNICDKYEISIEQFKNDIEKLSSLVNIDLIRLMGGEPLLHSELSKILPIVRKYFPNSKVALVSNGLLIPKMDDQLIESIKNNNVFFNISLYQPTYKIADKIVKFLDDKNIKFFFGNGCKQKDETLLILEFHTCLTTKKVNDPEKANNLCYGRHFPFVKDGFISRCSYPLLIQYLNEKCNSNFKTTENDFKKIDDFQNGDELIEYLEHFCDFCAYCTDKKLKRFEWQTSNKNNLSDYIV